MSKRPGAVPAETREAILRSAKQEFLEKGYQGSSLRRIGAAAGVTTGAIYFFFSGKDALFAAVLAQVTGPFLEAIREHYRREREDDTGQEEDLAVSRTLIDCYERNREGWDILRSHLGHPEVQKFLDTFVEESTEHYVYLWGRSPRGQNLDRFAVGQFVHMQADTMLNLISQGFDREALIRHAGTVTKMLRGAFHTLLEE